MPIPAFDGILNILPPHLGNPAAIGDLSPYACTVGEVCEQFATSNARREILKGFMGLRREMMKSSIRGFQWLGGSFLENIEAQERRDPKDLDVVTFIEDPSSFNDLEQLFKRCPELLIRSACKEKFGIDHFVVPLCAKSNVLVDQSRYWYGLFSHRRDGTWKGMLTLSLVDDSGDEIASRHLEISP